VVPELTQKYWRGEKRDGGRPEIISGKKKDDISLRRGKSGEKEKRKQDPTPEGALNCTEGKTPSGLGRDQEER